MDYDQHVRELALDKRAKPKDRTKTEEELALEAKEALEKAEKKRLKRMMGEEDGSSDDENGASSRKKARKNMGGDDLEDDFQEGEDVEWGGLGTGLEDGLHTKGADGDESQEDEGDSQEDGSSSEEGGSDASESDSPAQRPMSRKAEGKRAASSTDKELPYTFQCPGSLEDFLAIVEDVRDEDIPTVIQRIQALYHPSLGAENKFKLQVRFIIIFKRLPPFILITFPLI